MFRQIIILIVVLLTTFDTLALAGPFEDGFAAYKRKDYVTAVELWSSPAENGDEKSQYYLGQMYRLGLGVQKNIEKGIALIRLSAEHGYAEAQRSMALFYDLGLGVSFDPIIAMTWERKAAEQGYAPSQISLAQSYRVGHGVDENMVLAYMWLDLAAENSSADDANRNLARELRAFLASTMSSEQIAEAQKLAKEWKPQ